MHSVARLELAIAFCSSAWLWRPYDTTAAYMALSFRHVSKELYRCSKYHNLLTKELFRQDHELYNAASTCCRHTSYRHLIKRHLSGGMILCN